MGHKSMKAASLSILLTLYGDLDHSSQLTAGLVSIGARPQMGSAAVWLTCMRSFALKVPERKPSCLDSAAPGRSIHGSDAIADAGSWRIHPPVLSSSSVMLSSCVLP
ncbi:hypothetical protein BJY01DRAFT_228170 [Aspergillus pseudoustus]|uniref:Uncharacterized protein n=1 Tax=Aspergillus pseudoustus TaxID=1810923 RepID=A0ABR4IME7_9EURO